MTTVTPRLYSSLSVAVQELLDLHVGYQEAVGLFRVALLSEVLSREAGNRTHAAAALGVQRTYLCRMIRRYIRSERIARRGRS